MDFQAVIVAYASLRATRHGTRAPTSHNARVLPCLALSFQRHAHHVQRSAWEREISIDHPPTPPPTATPPFPLLPTPPLPFPSLIPLRILTTISTLGKPSVYCTYCKVLLYDACTDGRALGSQGAQFGTNGASFLASDTAAGPPQAESVFFFFLGSFEIPVCPDRSCPREQLSRDERDYDIWPALTRTCSSPNFTSPLHSTAAFCAEHSSSNPFCYARPRYFEKKPCLRVRDPPVDWLQASARSRLQHGTIGTSILRLESFRQLHRDSVIHQSVRTFFSL